MTFRAPHAEELVFELHLEWHMLLLHSPGGTSKDLGVPVLLKGKSALTAKAKLG